MIKYIFCISTGRSGTGYLANILSTLSDTKAYHEQKPRMNKEIMREFLKGNNAPLQSEMSKKVDLIMQASDGIYVDTSHIFIKSFGWEIPKYIPQNEIGIVILKRNKSKVVESFHRIQSSPFNDKGRDWIIYPNGNNLTSPAINAFNYKVLRFLLKGYWRVTGAKGHKKYPSYFRDKSYKLLSWYYDEIYALGNKFQKMYPQISYVEVNLEELNTFEGVERIIKKFGLEKAYNKEKLADLIDVPVNLKDNIK